MGEEGGVRRPSWVEEIDIRVVIEEQRKADETVAEARKRAEEILEEARKKAKEILAQSEAVHVDIKGVIDEERRRVEQELAAFIKEREERLAGLKLMLEEIRDVIRRRVLEELLRWV